MGGKDQDIHAEQVQIWDTKWKNNNTPWDMKAPHRALSNLLKRSDKGEKDVPAIPTSGNALVPGCGRGYDVQLFAERGLKAVGLDTSETAVEKAQEWLETKKDSLHGEGKATVRVESFFDSPRPENGYALMYDYTFLCALPPTLRQQWATTYTRLSTVTPSPTLLITLQFPLDDDKESGPPYSVGRKDDPNKLYQELLGEQWELVYDTAVSKDETREEEYHEGRERLAVWRRK